MSEGFTGIYQGIYYRNDVPICAASQMDNLSPQQKRLVSMPDLQPKTSAPAPESEPKKKKVVRRRKKSTKASTRSITAKSAAPAPAPTTPKKPLPASSIQPRDHLGRFASKAWGVTKAIGGHIGKGVAHVGKSAATAGKSAVQKEIKKGVKSTQQRRKKRKNTRLRERNIKIRKQEIALGLAAPVTSAKKKVIRRRKR